MSSKRIRTWVFLLGLVALSMAGWIFARGTASVKGFPLDDAWIHQTYARNLTSGEGWAFSPGVPSAGATAPLWVILLAPANLLGLTPFAWVAVLAVVQLLGMGALGITAWRLLGLEKAWGEIAVAGLLVFEWHLIWAVFSGMETLFYGIISLAVFTLLLKLDLDFESSSWRWMGVGALVGAAVWLRPEAVTLLGPIIMTLVLSSQKLPRQKIFDLLAVAAGFAVFFAAYLAFNKWLAGSWWPNTFYAKQAEYAILRDIPFIPRLVRQFSPLMAGVLTALLPGLVFFIYKSIRQRTWVFLAGALWALGHITMYAYRLPVIYQHGRYVIPALPLLLLIGAAGYYQATEEILAERPRWLVRRLWGGVILCLLVIFWVLGIQTYVKDVAIIDGEMVQTALWIEENTRPEDLIAAHDIGAIGYFTQRAIVDLAGLVSPDVIPFIRDESELTRYLDEICPEYLVTFPDWYEQLPVMGKMVFQTDTKLTREEGGTNMAVFQWIGVGGCP